MTAVRRLAAMALTLLPLLAGCTSLRIPVEQRGLVMLLGLDAAPGGAYTVTMSYMNPLGTTTVGQRSGAGQVSPAIIRTATAATLPAAIGETSAASYQYADLSHLSGVVVSAALARRGLAPVMDTFDRSADFSGFMYVGIVRHGTAHDLLLAMRTSLPEAGFVWTKTLQWANTTTPFVTERLPLFLDRMEMSGDEPITAAVGPAPGALDVGDPSVDVTGLAVFRGDRLQGWFDRQQALGWALLTGHCRLLPVSVGPAAAPSSLVLRGCRADLHLQSSTGPDFRVRLRLHGRLVAVADPTATFTGSAPDSLVPFEVAADRSLERDVVAALKQAQALGADPFGFGQQVRIQDPALWHTRASTWNTATFPRATFAVSVQTSIDAPGLTVLPLLSSPGG